MKLQDQVCSLEQARLLHKFKIKQHAYLFWHLGAVSDSWIIINGENSNIDSGKDYAAFSVAELGQMLPFELLNPACMDNRKVMNDSDSSVGIWKYKYSWKIRTVENRAAMDFKTEAQARAAMLIYLLKNKLLTADEANERLLAD